MPSEMTRDVASISQTAGQMVEEQFNRLTEQIDSLRKQLREAQRLAALGTMSAMIAHEFNNLMTPVISYAQYAMEKGDEALMKRAVEKSLQQAKRASQMCDRILGLASQQHLGPGPVEVASLVNETIASLGRDLSKDNIQLRLNVPEDLRVKANGSQLQQVLFNLVLNAQQAMKGRGTITISVARAEEGFARLSVADTGPGIPEEMRDRLFKPFQTTKKDGSGIGLALVKRFVDNFGGGVSVESPPGGGAVFHLRLPLAEEQSGRGAQAARTGIGVA